VKAIMQIILPIYKPNSIIDLGCGSGSWLHTISKEYKISEFLGVDGHWIDENELLIPQTNFNAHNLQDVYTPNRKFDMAISMEVAEHLNEEYADNFVTSLVNSSDLILFSAAIPLQGGTNHVNEQPQTYWESKFSKNNYECVDIIRSRIWNLEGVRTDYKQNTFLYINKSQTNKANLLLNKFRSIEQEKILYVVHPELFERKLDIAGNLKVIGLKRVIKSLPILFACALYKKFKIMRFSKSC
jgi:hypothetical protein